MLDHHCTSDTHPGLSIVRTLYLSHCHTDTTVVQGHTRSPPSWSYSPTGADAAHMRTNVLLPDRRGRPTAAAERELPVAEPLAKPPAEPPSASHRQPIRAAASVPPPARRAAAS